MLAGRLRRDRLGGPQRRHDLGVVGAGHGVALRCVGRGSDLGGADDVERRQRAGIGDVGEIVLVMRRRRLCRNRLGGPGRRHDPRAVDALGGIALRRVGGRMDLLRADRVQSGQGAGIGDVGDVVLMLRGGRLCRNRLGGAQRGHDLGMVGAGHGFALRCIGCSVDLGGAHGIQRRQRAGVGDVGEIMLMRGAGEACDELASRRLARHARLVDLEFVGVGDAAHAGQLADPLRHLYGLRQGNLLGLGCAVPSIAAAGMQRQ